MDSNISEDLTPEIYQCQVCWEDMLKRKPRSLTCGHSFCQQCLERLQSEGGVICPTCRCETMTPDGVDKLPPDVKLSKFKDMEKDLVLNVDFLCQMCFMKGKKVQAIIRCIQCYRTMCEPCKDMHNKLPAFKGHKLDPIQPPEVSNKVCHLHGQTITYLCHECMRGICIDCMFSSDHTEHNDKIEDFDTGCRNARIKAEEIQNDLEHEEAKLEKRENQIRLDMAKMLQISTGLNQQKLEFKAKMQEADDAIQDIEKTYREPTEKIKRTMFETREKLKPTVAILNELKSKNDHEFVTDFRKIIPDAENQMTEARKVLDSRYQNPPSNKALYDKNTPSKASENDLSLDDFLKKKPVLILNIMAKHGSSSGKNSSEQLSSSGENSSEDIDFESDASDDEPDNILISKLQTEAELFDIVTIDSKTLLIIEMLSEKGDKIYRIDNKGNIISCHYLMAQGIITGACLYDGTLYISSVAENEQAQIKCTPFNDATPMPDDPVVYKAKLSDEMDTCFISSPIFLDNNNGDNSMFFTERTVDSFDENKKNCLLKHNISTGRTTLLNDNIDDAWIVKPLKDSGEAKFAVSCEAGIKILDKDGGVIRTIGGEESGEGALGKPAGLAVTRSGHILVADNDNKCIHLYDVSGQFLKTILTQEDSIENPTFIALHGRRLWVSQENDDDNSDNPILKCFIYK